MNPIRPEKLDVLEKILDHVGSIYGFSPEQLLDRDTPRRGVTKRLAFSRYLSMHLAIKYADFSRWGAERLFEFSHPMGFIALKKIEAARDSDPELAAIIERAEEEMGND